MELIKQIYFSKSLEGDFFFHNYLRLRVEQDHSRKKKEKKRQECRVMSGVWILKRSQMLNRRHKAVLQQIYLLKQFKGATRNTRIPTSDFFVFKIP